MLISEFKETEKKLYLTTFKSSRSSNSESVK